MSCFFAMLLTFVKGIIALVFAIIMMHIDAVLSPSCLPFIGFGNIDVVCHTTKTGITTSTRFNIFTWLTWLIHETIVLWGFFTYISSTCHSLDWISMSIKIMVYKLLSWAYKWCKHEKMFFLWESRFLGSICWQMTFSTPLEHHYKQANFTCSTIMVNKSAAT